MKIKRFKAPRIRLLLCMVIVLASMMCSLLPAKPAAADDTNPIAGKTGTTTTPNDTGSNYLLLIAQQCQGLNPSNNIQEASYEGCKDWANNNLSALNCNASSMFYQVQQNAAGTISNAGTWYINEGTYKTCYNAASAQLAVLKSSICSSVVNNSDNWNSKCQPAQTELNTTLGCSGTMFSKADKSNVRSIDSSKLSDCESRVEQVGDIHLDIVDSSGNVTKDTNAISSSQVSTTSSGNGTGSGTDPGSGGTALTCDTEVTDPLTWILCPVVNILTDTVNSIDGWITNELDIKADSIFCNDTQSCQAYHVAWASFRDIALGLMVAGGVVMLIAHSMGMEILDAYTIRKILPRLLIAAVAISLSWPLMRFMINMSDALGYGIRHIIYAPFSNLQGNGIDLTFGSSFGGGIENFFFGSLGFVAAVGAGIAAIGIIISLAGTAALAVLIAIFVLVIRQIAITLLVLIAPIAIVAYIFPNTKEIYRLWWDSFSKALMMFPLIAAFIATGRVFSAISLSGSSPDILHDVIGFLAYFAPYFLIPATFKLAGGAVRQLGGFVNDRSRGGFDRLRAGRVKKMETLGQRAKSNELYEGKRWMPGSMKAAEFANRRIAGVGTGYRGRYGMGKRGKEAIAQANEIAGRKAAEDPHLQAIAGNDLANRALVMGQGDARKGRDAVKRHLMSGGDDGKTFLNEADAEAKADTAMKSAGAATRFTKAASVAALRNMVRGGTAIRDTDDLSELAATAGDGNYGNTYGLAAEAASVSRQVGRSDLASSAEAAGMLALSRSDQLSGRTGGAALYDPRTNGGKSHSQLQYESWETATGGETAFSALSNGKSRTIKNNTRTAVEVMKNHRTDIEAGRKSRYAEKEVQFAAASLQDTKEGVTTGTGRLGNRRAAQEELDKDGGALDWYMDTKVQIPERRQVGSDVSTQAPIYAESLKTTNNREVIEKIVGGRYGGMSDDQRAQMMQAGASEQEKK